MQIIYDYTFYKVIIGTTLIGIITGILGCFTLLRRQSLLGDTIAHATLPGLTGMFMFVLDKSYLLLLLGASTTGLLGAFCVHFITSNTTLKKDTALGIILSVFFGIGMIFLTIIQKMPTANQAGIDKFLFGHASTLLYHDIIILSIIAAIVIATVLFFWKEFKIITFDPEYAKTIGIPINKINCILTLLIVLTIIVGLQTIGLILISSFLISPATSARQWTTTLSSMILLSIVFSLIATVMGTYISCGVANTPTGPVIVVISTFLTLLSILLSPQGSLSAWLTQQQNQKQIKAATMLTNFMLFNESETNPFHPHDITALKAIGKKGISGTLNLLEKQGLLENTHDNFWRLTKKGLEKARQLQKGRNACL